MDHVVITQCNQAVSPNEDIVGSGVRQVDDVKAGISVYVQITIAIWFSFILPAKELSLRSGLITL